MDTTFERLCAILVRDHRLPPERLVPDAPLADLGIDSLATVELLWHVEEAFGIELPSAPGDLSTLADVVHCIDGLVAGQGGTPAPASPASPEAASLQAP